MSTQNRIFPLLRFQLDVGYALHLQCVASRSGMSMSVYHEVERVMTVRGCGIDRLSVTIGRILEECYQPELQHDKDFRGFPVVNGRVVVDGNLGRQQMRLVAAALGLTLDFSLLRDNAVLITLRKAK
jgi:hypothetical protein